MEKVVLAVSRGIFSLTETDKENVLYFYRNDGGMLGDVGRIPMELYQLYLDEKRRDEPNFGIERHRVEMHASPYGQVLSLHICPIDKLAAIPAGQIEGVVEKRRDVKAISENLIRKILNDKKKD